MDPDGHCCWDEITGFVGGALNIVPDTANLGISAVNYFLPGDSQIDELQRITPDNRVSENAMKVGTIASFAIPVGGEERGGIWVAEQISNIESKVANIATKVLTPETLSAASREVNGGMKVAKAGGGFFDHAGKVELGINGLNKQLAHAQKVLARPNLGEEATAALKTQINTIQDVLAKAREAITHHP
jgi:hypothetical protein